MNPVNKVQIIEIPIAGVSGGNTLTTVTFPDQPFLRNKFINFVEVFTVNDMSLSPLGNPPLTEAQMKTAYLSLYSQDPETHADFGEWTERIPFVDMHRMSNGTDPFTYYRYEIAPRQVQWEKSKVFFASALGNTAAVSILLSVGYQNSF